jgi:hypothetical protein
VLRTKVIVEDPEEVIVDPVEVGELGTDFSGLVKYQLV